jgi:hypothetical protein
MYAYILQSLAQLDKHPFLPPGRIPVDIPRIIAGDIGSVLAKLGRERPLGALMFPSDPASQPFGDSQCQLLQPPQEGIVKSKL